MAFRLHRRLLTCATAFTLIALSLAGTMTVLAPAPVAQAAPAPAFDCTVPRFFAQAEDPVGTVKLNTGSYTTSGGSQWTQIGTNYTGANVFNALAFNPTDEYLYGTFYGQTSGTNIRGSLARINRSGAVTPLGDASTALGAPPSTLWDSGEFDSAGNYYVASGNAGTTTIQRIAGLKDVTSATSTPRPTRTTITLSRSIRFADLTFLKGYLWAANYGQAPELYRINPSTGAVTAFTVPTDIMPTNSYGSAFTMTNGNLALIATNGFMYQIAIRNADQATPTFELISRVTAPANQRSDATNCATALESKLSVTKTGPATVVVGKTITWRVVVKNEGPGNTSGFVLNDVLPNNLGNVSVTSTDTSCVVTGTTQKVATCNGGYLPVGAEAVVNVSATAPSTPGPLINKAYAIGNEDPNPAPPATAETQVVLATEVNVPATVTDTSNGTYDSTSVKGGTVAYAAGRYTYTPPAGFSGSDSFTYRTSDGTLVTVLVQVTPQADPGSRTTQAGVPVTISEAALQALGRGTGLELVGVGSAEHGTVALDQGVVTYTPAAGFSGTGRFTYTLRDASGQEVTQTITVTVTNVFSDESAVEDGVTTPQNTAKKIPLADVVSPSGRPLDPTKVTVPGAPDHGRVTVDPVTGELTYTPDAGYVGDDEFDVRVCDTSDPAQCTTVTIMVAVSPNTVTADDDTASTPVATPRTIDVRGNDESASGQPFAAPSVTTAPAHGSTVVESDGRITYTPAAGFSGVDTFQYRVCDTSTPTAECDAATVTVTVTNVFAEETAAEDGVTTRQNTPKDIPLTDVVSATGQPLDPTKVTVSEEPSHGDVTVDPTTGELTYTPDAGYTGDDEFDVRVCDTSDPAQCSTVTINVTVTANTVTATADTATTPVETPQTINVRGNDDSASGQSLAAPTVTTAPAHGTAVVESDGRITYTPEDGFSGEDTFEYRVCDTSTPTAACDTATVTVTVTNVFSDGSAVEDGVTTPQNTPKDIPLADVVSPSGEPLDPAAVTIPEAPAHGEVTVDPTTGELTYTPDPGYSGDDEFDVRVCDTSSPAQCTTVTIEVTVGANTVAASDDTATTEVGTATAVLVRQNDTSLSGQALALPSVTTAPEHGTASVTVDGRIVYTPEDGFSGEDTFEYRVCDTSTPTSVCDTATVTVTVENVFSDGTAAQDGVKTPQNTAKDIPLADVVSATGKPVDPTKVTVSEEPGHGEVTVDPTTGELTYTPVPGYTGDDEFEVRVCDTSDPVQCSTVAIGVTVGANTVEAADDSATTAVETPRTINVRGNDDSASGQALAAPAVTTAPAHGTTVVESDGRITYTPAAGFSGEDTFEYRVCDTSAPTAVCDTATVTVTVENVFSDESAVEDGVSTPHNTAKKVALDDVVSATGTPLDPTKVTIPVAPEHGTATVDPVTGELTYAPVPGYTGDDQFEVRVCDTSAPVQCTRVTIEVTVGANTVEAADDSATTSVETPRTINVRGNDDSESEQPFAAPTVTTAPGHGTAVVESDGRITYTPEDGFSGEDTFEYRVCDTSTPTPVCDTATVTVTVENAFAEETAVEDGVATPQNTPQDIPLSDVVSPSGKPLDPTTVTVPDGPDHGEVTVDPTTGELTYTPDPGYSGDDEFEVRVCDTSVPAQCTTVTIGVEVSANAVAAADDSATTALGTEVDVDVRDNDSSASGQALAHPTVTTAPEHGTAVVDADGLVTYTPEAGFSGEDTFEYRVCDTSTPTPVCDTATVTVTVVNAFTNTPLASDGVETDQDEALTIPLADLVSSAGAALDPQSVVAGRAAHGDVTVDPQTGAVTYTPNDGYSGDDAFDLRVCDTSKPVQCHTVTIPVKVRANTVVTGDDKATTQEGRPVVIEVEGNDTSRTGRPLTAARVTTQPKHGVAEVLQDGTVRYTPKKGFVGTDSFEYERCDDSTPVPVCDTATVMVDVTAAPDAPAEPGDDPDVAGDDDSVDGSDRGDEKADDRAADRSPLADTGSSATLGALAGGLGAIALGALAIVMARRRRA
ncbi:tandem-95 repeat protein [Aeromicrobium sp. Marseille-Q0843]|uniref:Tandem-95 repeat protein n=1 Tax=Aeromicrobium phoceense TaxID=2754045 RepID=A0A838XCK7_9ACTN|nr:Ig-like domain-containing protein [Aeromicrobium phoceense]MBA4607557.1 tandem-95 repeat protein [Aeromicrobium phoceense]